MTIAVTLEQGIPARMRDGTILYADVYRPEGAGPFPVLMNRTPYDRSSAAMTTYRHPEWWARRGYIVVIQDVRGRYTSEGEWYPYRHEVEDGYDSVEWAASLPGSNGRVGMYGFSYTGATQLLAALGRPPHLASMVPGMTGHEYYQGWTYEGGAFSQAFIQSWTLGLIEDTAHRLGREQALEELREAMLAMPRIYARLPLTELVVPEARELAPYYFDWLQHHEDDAYWRRWAIHEQYEQVSAPALHVAGWYDVFLQGALRNYEGLRARGATPEARAGQRLLVGPWHHMPWSSVGGGHDFGEEGGNIVNEQQLRWFDYTLRDQHGIESEPPVRIFVMGENRWRSEDEWPLRRAIETSYYLHSTGGANSMHGDGELTLAAPGDEEPDVFVYHADNPVPSLGGHSCCYEEITPMGAYDQRKVEVRSDVLCYTTPPLVENTEVTGWVRCALWAATSAVDTDWTAKLVDVYPDGRAVNITDGIVRARYRDSLERPSPLIPGEVYRYEIGVRATSNVFKAGHRIRLEVSSSNFPMYDRNPGTGQPPGAVRYSDLGIARQTVFHDQSRPSHVVLPIVRG